mmetsp:Transcript_23796/g.66684  ORF Transcript_23796/g.66684 Transcript_23796/m.66684 type:complete len:90 (-) Transcript_23796:1003-1272(-)
MDRDHHDDNYAYNSDSAGSESDEVDEWFNVKTELQEKVADVGTLSGHFVQNVIGLNLYVDGNMVQQEDRRTCSPGKHCFKVPIITDEVT